MGILRTPKNEIPLGLEAAGIVRQVGADVQDIVPGHRVLAMPPSACAKSAIVVPASLVQQIPDALTFEDAATMPICYGTVIEGLINLGQLTKGQVSLVLIVVEILHTNGFSMTTVCPYSLCHWWCRSCCHSRLPNNRS